MMNFTHKFLIIFIVAIFSFNQGISQTNLQWYFTNVGASNGNISQLLEFPNGDVLVQGINFGGDMDPGPGTSILSTTTFFARYTSSGSLIFCRPLSYNGANTNMGSWMTMDSIGNFYFIIHGVAQTFDLDPIPGVGEIASNGGDILVKFSPMGIFQWANVFTEDFNIVRLKALSDNSVVISGTHYYGPGDFDPGPGVVPINTTCVYDGFVSKFDSAGTFIAGKQFPSTSGVYNDYMLMGKFAADANDNIYVGGKFIGEFDADPGSGIFTLTGTKGFVIKLDENLDFVFATIFHDDLTIIDIVAGPSDAFYFAGFYDQPVDIDPFAGVTMLNTDPNFGCIYIAKFDSTGHLGWAKTLKTGSSIMSQYTAFHSADENGHFDFVLYLNDTIDTNSFGFPQLPGIGFSTNGQYMVRLDPAGACELILRLPEISYPIPLITDPNHFYLSGRMMSPTDIQMGPGITNESPTVGNEFVLSYYSRDLTLNQIQGKAFIDLNSNNILDLNENGISNLIAEINPGNIYTSTDNLGDFGTYVPAGNYLIKIPGFPSVFYDPTPLVHSANFASTNQIDTANNFAFTLNLTEADVAVYLTAMNPSRPGMNTVFNITYTNEGASVQSGEIKVYLDSNTTFLSSTISPALVNGQQVSWNFSNLNPLQSMNINFTVNVDSTMQNGDTLINTVEISSLVGDNYLTNNYDTVTTVLTGSIDPNNKLVNPSVDISDEQAEAGMELTYTINFQNTGNDTAFFVTILDTLSSNLDIGSLNIIASSHPYYFTLYPGNLMEFRFNNILLPDSNVNEISSHGFIKYKIKVDSTLTPGDFIENNAAIYFDFNQPVITNTTHINIVDFVGIQENNLTLGSIVYPNPFVNEFIVKIPNQSKEKVEYILCDIAGKTICKYESAANEFKINVENISNGIYLLKIRKGNNSDFIKVVKL